MVVKAFKQFFIPHKHNDYKPHFFREVSIVSITVVALALLIVSASTTLYIKNTDMTATVLPAVLVDLTNNARTSNNEEALTRSQILDTVAKLKAEDMASFGYFAHTSPSGVTPWYWFDKAGYSFVYAGENLAIDFTESVDVENAWLNSPTHKANIMSAHFTEIGIATVDGLYQGRPTTYVVQEFGTPIVAQKNTTPPAVEVKPKENVNPIKPKPSTLPAVVALAPDVKGEATTIPKNLETITDTQEFIAVRNTATEDKVEAASAHRTTQYSTWYQKFMFMAPAYANRIYKIFIYVVLAGLLLMTIFEVSRKHKKNIIYGILLLVIMVSLIYINKSMFITSFFA
jgi:hypothetical protein